MINPIKLPPFKHFCVTIGNLPTSYVDSLSYYEMLEWLCHYLQDTVIPALNTNGEAVTELQTLFTELQEYVNNYFDNLDVQEEINNKLDEMAESGELTDIIAQYLGLAGVLSYNTVSDMKSAQNLTNGSICQTLGYHSINDGGKALYKVRTITNDDIIDEATIISLSDNTLIAELVVRNELNPEMFGAYGDGTHDDHNALIKIIKYANVNKASYDNNNYKSMTIKFNNKKYLNNSTIVFNSDSTTADTLNIDGNGAYIIGYGFEFAINAGWKLHINNLNMANMTTAFDFKTRNLEYGKYIFENIEFVDITNPFIMDRRSCTVEIRNCIFRRVMSIGRFKNVDRLNFHHNWIEPDNVTGVDYKSMLLQETGDEGSMFIYNNLFVPAGGSNCKELCWIEVNEHARIYNNRFGGENANYHPVRIGAGFLPKSNESSKYPYISFDHNDDVHGSTSIILESIAGNMLFEYNQGWLGGGKMLEWSDKIDSTDQATLISNQANMLNLVIKNNVGRNVLRYGNGTDVVNAYLPTIPTNLYGLINRGTRSIVNNTGENRAYLEYLAPVADTSQILTIKKQPFNNISQLSLAGRYANVSNFAILLWAGFGYRTNYECKSAYILITFELVSDSTNLKIHTTSLGEEVSINVLFSNGTDTIDITTLSGVNDLPLTISTSQNLKTIKYIKAQIFRPENQLTCFI